MKNPPSNLLEYIRTVLDVYMSEDFTDITKKTSSNPSAPTPSPTTEFNMDELKKITSLEQILGYVLATLPKIGEGQGRVVYKLGSGGTVLKVAKNVGGMGQNQAEAAVCAGTTNAVDLFPKVLETHPKFMWLVTEQATPMTPDVFAKLTGLSWTKFQSGLKGAFQGKATNVSQIDKQNFIDSSNNPFFSKIVQIIKECKYEPGDIAKLDSWGVIRGKPVILDSGFTEAVNQAYYKK